MEINKNNNLPKALVVDDNTEMIIYLKEIFSDFLDCTFAFNGKEALNKIEDEILKNRIMKIVWGTGVAFTSLEIDDDFNPGPESFSFQILDKLGMVNPIRYYLKSLSDGWHNILSKKGWYNHALSKPSKEDCE